MVVFFHDRVGVVLLYGFYIWMLSTYQIRGTTPVRSERLRVSIWYVMRNYLIIFPQGTKGRGNF